MKARFNVAEITRYGNGGGTKVVLLPSTGNAPENNVLWSDSANPNGRIELHMSAPDAESLFEMGEYVVEFRRGKNDNGKKFFCNMSEDAIEEINQAISKATRSFFWPDEVWPEEENKREADSTRASKQLIPEDTSDLRCMESIPEGARPSPRTRAKTTER